MPSVSLNTSSHPPTPTPHLKPFTQIKFANTRRLSIARSLESEAIVACHRYGLNVVTYNPLAGGLFSGKIKSSSGVPASGRFSDAGGTGKNYRARYFRDATFDALALIEKTAEKHQLTMLEIGLRWVMHHSKSNVAQDGGDGIIIGVSSYEQLEGNLRDLEKGPLPEEVVKTLDEAWAVCKGTTPNYWHLPLEYKYDTKEALFGRREAKSKV